LKKHNEQPENGSEYKNTYSADVRGRYIRGNAEPESNYDTQRADYSAKEEEPGHGSPSCVRKQGRKNEQCGSKQRPITRTSPNVSPVRDILVCFISVYKYPDIQTERCREKHSK
jgi:hypothetical protein